MAMIWFLADLAPLVIGTGPTETWYNYVVLPQPKGRKAA